MIKQSIKTITNLQ